MNIEELEELEAAIELVARDMEFMNKRLLQEGITPDPQSDLVLEAARLVANPNIEATARLLADHRGVDWADTTYMDACRRMAEQYIAAALTPPGATDE